MNAAWAAWRVVRGVQWAISARQQHLPAIFADFDFKDTAEDQVRRDLATYAFPPSALVHSGHGLHAYWLLSEPLDLQDAGERALASTRCSGKRTTGLAW